MPNTHNTLTGLFTDIADAIREKDGTSTPKVADAFPAAIRAIPTGGGDTDAEDGIIARTISGAYENSRVTKIGSYAFYNCTRITTVSFPVCQAIDGSAFYNCTSLTTVSFPACTKIGGYAFTSCISLTTASFPVCTFIDISAFTSCISLTTASFPVCQTIAGNAFYNCTSLATVSFPACKMIYSSAFGSCYSLTTAAFPACANISGNAFRNCYNLLSLYIGASSVCKMVNSNAFTSTPIAGYTASTGGMYGSIFVPASLVSAYKSSTNWTYFADRITAIPEGA